MSQLSLFEARVEPLNLPDGDACLIRKFLPEDEAKTLFEGLQFQVTWRQDTIVVYGQRHLLPRLQQWYGDAGLSYTYSGVKLEPQPWIPLLLPIKEQVEKEAGTKFNSLLLNFYRTGNDTVGFHSDDEPELGKNPVIASVSLGTEREFVMKHKTRSELKPIHVALTHGSLLLMAGVTQANWLHSVPRRKGIKDPRINLTFRYVNPRSA